MAADQPICPECGKPIFLSDMTTAGQALVEDESGEPDEEMSAPVLFHRDCFPKWQAKMEGEPDTA